MSRPTKKVNSKFLKSHEIDTADNISFIKKQKRKPNNTGFSQLQLKEIHPLTENQGKVFNAFRNTDKHLVLSGCPGSGKSYIALYLALSDLLYGDNSYNKIVILRSIVTSRSAGFLPGSISEKQEPHFAPYHEICYELFGRGDASEILLKKDIIEFQNTSYLRGVTFNNAIIIVDEFQNENFSNLSTIITRVSDSSRILFCGDFAQSDLMYNKNDVTGFTDFMRILSNMEEFSITDFTVDDIVRGGMVKSYIIQKMKLGL